MKFGMKRMLGLGFVAALMGLASKGKEQAAIEASSPFGTSRIMHGNPIYFGASQRKSKTNKQRCSHNAKLNRRKSK